MTITEIQGPGDFDDSVFANSMGDEVRDPYAALAAAREATPVLAVPNALDPSGPPAFAVHRHADITRVLRDNAVFSSSVLQSTMGPAMGDRILVGMDEPRHRVQRALVSVAFRQRALGRWEDALVKRVVDNLVDGFVADGHAELVRQFNFSFPTQVIAAVLGLPADDYQRFRRWALAINSLYRDWERGVTASRELRAYLGEIIEERRRHRGDDVISDLVRAEVDGERLDDEDIFSFIGLLMPAGIETTFHFAGNLTYLLLTHPDQLAAVRADPGLMPQAIEEGLRFEPPLLLTTRIALSDTEVGGVAVPAGSLVSPMLGAGNRDPRVYADPDRFDIFRDPRQLISFGYGVHVCLGMHLARMETRVAVGGLIARLPGLRLDHDAAQAADAHIHGQIFRTPTLLPVLWD